MIFDKESFFESFNLKFLIVLITIAVFVVLILLLTKVSKKLKTKELTLSAVCVALSFVLSIIKVKIGANGGSITMFSMIPIILFAYYYGFIKGLFVGVIYGLLQYIESPNVINALTFFLDYIFAYSSICLAPVFKRVIKNKTASLLMGIVLVYSARLIFHTLSGIFYFPDYAFFAGLYASLIYNASYVLPETALSIIFVLLTAKSKSLERLFIANK